VTRLFAAWPFAELPILSTGWRRTTRRPSGRRHCYYPLSEGKAIYYNLDEIEILFLGPNLYIYSTDILFVKKTIKLKIGFP
jgi:hypothetical protein